MPTMLDRGLQAAQLLLVLAHGSSAAQSYLGRQDTLQGLLDIMALVPAAVLAVLLRVVKHLSTDPQLLQSLQVGSCIRFARQHASTALQRLQAQAGASALTCTKSPPGAGCRLHPSLGDVPGPHTPPRAAAGRIESPAQPVQAESQQAGGRSLGGHRAASDRVCPASALTTPCTSLRCAAALLVIVFISGESIHRWVDASAAETGPPTSLRILASLRPALTKPAVHAHTGQWQQAQGAGQGGW